MPINGTTICIEGVGGQISQKYLAAHSTQIFEHAVSAQTSLLPLITSTSVTVYLHSLLVILTNKQVDMSAEQENHTDSNIHQTCMQDCPMVQNTRKSLHITCHSYFHSVCVGLSKNRWRKREATPCWK